MRYCSYCHRWKDESEFGKSFSRNKDGLRRQCKDCRCKYAREYRKNNLNKVRMQENVSHRKHRKIVSRKWKLLHRSKLNNIRRSYAAKARANLIDIYIINCIHQRTGVSSMEIRQYPEIIKTTREVLKFKRAYKQFKQSINQKQKEVWNQ